MPETIHIVRESPKYSFYFLLMLLPALVFIFVIIIFVGNVPQSNKAASTTVLGVEVQLDK